MGPEQRVDDDKFLHSTWLAALCADTNMEDVPDEYKEFVQAQINSGKFATVKDVIRAGIITLYYSQQENAPIFEYIRKGLARLKNREKSYDR